MKTVEIIYRYWSPGAPTRPRLHDAESARLRLSDGNHAFATLLESLSEGAGLARRVIDVDPRDLGLLQGEHSSLPQHPFAVVLGCSDARVPIELIFNEGPNDLFVVRVAGNGLGHDVLGSLWYALEHLRESLRLVVILGHSGCGAVSAAVDAFLHPLGYLSVSTSYSLRGILDRLLIVVEAARANSPPPMAAMSWNSRDIATRLLRPRLPVTSRRSPLLCSVSWPVLG